MATWQYHETKLLQKLWADKNIQEQPSSSGRKKTLWDNLSKETRNAGYDHTDTQCKTRIHKLAQRYKKEKRLRAKWCSNVRAGRSLKTLTLFLGVNQAQNHP